MDRGILKAGTTERYEVTTTFFLRNQFPSEICIRHATDITTIKQFIA